MHMDLKQIQFYQSSKIKLTDFPHPEWSEVHVAVEDAKLFLMGSWHFLALKLC